MKNIIAAAILSLNSALIIAQTSSKPVVLYGTVQQQDLQVSPFREWFQPNFESYRPADSMLKAIKQLPVKDITIEIFMGTWCGDSKREVPRFYKLLENISFPQQQVKLIALGAGDSLVKQSPQHEEAGKGIFRVPTFIIYKKGKEINRINEYPAFSLEKDLYTILSGSAYEPNYRSFATVKKWLADGTLLDMNSSNHGLAEQIRPLVTKESELNSLGRLLQQQGRKEEGLRILQINTILFSESAMLMQSLGEAYLNTGDAKNAVTSLEKAIELNKDPQRLKEILKLLYEAKGVKERI